MKKRGLHLTEEIVRAAYDYLNATMPFARWNLPHGDEVVFKIVTTRSMWGWYSHDACKDRKHQHEISISQTAVSHTYTLMGVMAHEMVHLHTTQAKMPTNHGPTFRKLWAEVAASHGFDPGPF